MPYRHYDFARIYNEFVNYYKDKTKADIEYYDWLRDMSLDETLEYGQARESFRWAKDMLQYLKEDVDYKYYKVFVGFPLKSMNSNVYSERDLIASALTVKGKSPSLNHKDEFWFSPKNPRNRWGNIDIMGGKYEDGAVEAIIRVPKDMICPICDGRKMTELIDSKKIVNVSLEGDCAGGICDVTGECRGFYFTDPPFTLLTTDVLPGIPLARIKPLEAYLPFSQSSNYGGKTNMKRKENRIILKPTKIVEDDNTTVDTHSRYNVDTFRGTFGTPIQQDSKLHGETQSSGNTQVLTGKSPGDYFMKHNAPTEACRWQEQGFESGEACIAAMTGEVDDPEAFCYGPAEAKRREQDDTVPPTFMQTGVSDPKDYAPTAGPADDVAMPKPEDEEEGPSKTKPPDHPIEPTPGAPTEFPTVEKPETEVGEEPPKADDKVVVGTPPKPAEQQEEPVPELPPCPEGEHRDPESGLCVADAPSSASEQADDCEPGYHKDEEGNCVPDVTEQEEEPCADGYHRDAEGNCVPDEPLDERVKRIKAETREVIALGQSAQLRKEMKNLETVWVSKYSQLDRQLQKANAYNHSQDKILKQQRQQIRKEQLRCEDLRVEIRDLKNRHSDSVTTTTKYGHLIEDLKIENADLKRKYHGALKTNLELSRKVTTANEEYLQLAKVKEQIENKFNKARINAKKTLKLRV